MENGKERTLVSALSELDSHDFTRHDGTRSGVVDECGGYQTRRTSKQGVYVLQTGTTQQSMQISKPIYQRGE